MQFHVTSTKLIPTLQSIRSRVDKKKIKDILYNVNGTNTGRVCKKKREGLDPPSQIQASIHGSDLQQWLELLPLAAYRL